MNTAEMVTEKLENLGYWNVMAEVGNESITVLAEGPDGSLEFAGKPFEAAGWARRLPSVVETVMSPEEWDALYGNITDVEVNEALMVGPDQIWATEADEGCIALVPVGNATTLVEKVPGYAKFWGQMQLIKRRKQNGLERGERMEQFVSELPPEKFVIQLPGMVPTPAKEPWDVILEAKARRTPVHIKYADVNGVLTDRTIRVAAVGETRVIAYCYWRKGKRHFLKDRVLDASLVGDTEALKEEARDGLGYTRPHRAGYVWAVPVSDEVIRHGGWPHWTPPDSAVTKVQGWVVI